jgi:hypothetical protein
MSSVGSFSASERKSAASVAPAARSGRRTSSASTSSSLDLPDRFSALVTARYGVVSAAAMTCVWAIQSASAVA